MIINFGVNDPPKTKIHRPHVSHIWTSISLRSIPPPQFGEVEAVMDLAPSQIFRRITSLFNVSKCTSSMSKNQVNHNSFPPSFHFLHLK